MKNRMKNNRNGNGGRLEKEWMKKEGIEKRRVEKKWTKKEWMEKGAEGNERTAYRLAAGLLAGAMLAGGILTGCGSKGGDRSTSTGLSETAVNTAAEEGYLYEEKPAAMDAGAAEMAGSTEEAADSVAETVCSTVDGEDDRAYRQGGTEEYSEWEEKGFASVYNEPLSTFSADVDTASYSNLRRLIQDGYGVDELPEGAVRIEEIINYFSYEDLKEPEGREPFGVTTQIMPCPWNRETQLLRIGLKTKDVDAEDFPDSNLVFLLDVSGSMYSADKLPLLQESFALLAENLTEKDCVSIVTYAGEDAVVIEGVRGNETKKICRALYDLEAGGSTHGSRGIETAYRLAEEYFIEGGNNRVILATDGDLNVGLTTEEELEELISEKKESGVFLSVLGFGRGNIKDNRMETLADKGNGNYAYIDSLREANKVLVEEMSATLLTVCKDVKFQVEFNPAVVEEYRLIGYDNRRLAAEDFDDDKKDAGEIGAGHCVIALYEIVTTEQINGRGKSDRELKYARFYEDAEGGDERDTKNIKAENDIKEEKNEEAEEKSYEQYEWLTVSIRYKEPEDSESRLLEYPVDFSSYTEEPGEDFLFAAAAAEFGLAAMESEYKADASLRHVAEVVDKLDSADEYRAEFGELVYQLQQN